MTPAQSSQEWRKDLPKNTLIWWESQQPAFTPVMEGGGGTLSALSLIAGISVFMAVIGFRMMDTRGIDSFGPALIFLSILVFFTLLLWVLIKEGLRSRHVAFVLTARGAGILPSDAQRRLDARMGWISRLVFLLTWKGGQWGAYAPFTPWKAVRKVVLIPENDEILLTGGAWHIRLLCGEAHYEPARKLILEKIAQSAPKARILEKTY